MFFTEANNDEKEHEEADAKGADALAVVPLGLPVREVDLARSVVR